MSAPLLFWDANFIDVPVPAILCKPWSFLRWWCGGLVSEGNISKAVLRTVRMLIGCCGIRWEWWKASIGCEIVFSCCKVDSHYYIDVFVSPERWPGDPLCERCTWSVSECTLQTALQRHQIVLHQQPYCTWRSTGWRTNVKQHIVISFKRHYN